MNANTKAGLLKLREMIAAMADGPQRSALKAVHDNVLRGVREERDYIAYIESELAALQARYEPRDRATLNDAADWAIRIVESGSGIDNDRPD